MASQWLIHTDLTCINSSEYKTNTLICLKLKITQFIWFSELFGDQKEHRTREESDNHESRPEVHHKESGWMPSFSPTPSFTKPLRKPDHMAPTSKPKASKTTTYHHNLPFDSYNPKYNNNPDGFGYQEDFRVSDLDETGHNEPSSASELYGSSSSKRFKKARPQTGSPSQGSKFKKTNKRPASTTTYNDKVRSKVGGIKNRSPELDLTELRPPRPA